MKKLLLICSILLLGNFDAIGQTLDATFSIVGGARLQMVLNTDATFQFSESYYNAGGVTVIVKNVYNTMPSPGSTGTATGPSYSTTGGLTGTTVQMGTYQADFGSFIAATDEEITFSISSTINSGDYFTLPAGTYSQNLPGNYGGGQTFNAGPYVAVISNQGFTGTAATLVVPPTIGEIAITGNTVNIVNGDATPQVSDFTDFESGCSAITKSFTLHNYSNTANLTLAGSAPNYITLSGSNDFSISLQPSIGTISQLNNLNFDITFNPSGSGIKTAIISIANNDINEAPFTFTVQGNAALPAVVVSKNNSIAGTVKGPNHVARTFTLTSGELGGCTSLSEVELEINLLIGSGTDCNIGSSAYGVHGDLAIQLESPSGTKVQLVQDDWGYFTGNASQVITYADSAFPSTDATVYFDDDAIVSANSETAMTSGNRVPHNPLSAFDGEDATGTWTVSVADGDAQFSAADYVCFVTANLHVTCGSGGACPTSPEIDILGSGVSILDGDSTPDLTDDTEFGTTAIPVVKTYTIDNTAGTANLNITTIVSSGVDAIDFVVGGITLPAVISAGVTTTFTVTFTPLTPGLKTATITVNNDDVSEAVYDYLIQGTGDVVLNIDDNLLHQLSNIYPNPNNGNFTLSYSGKEQLNEFQVIDMLGKRVQTISLENFDNSQEINLVSLAKGIYFITIQSDSTKATKRLIIE